MRSLVLTLVLVGSLVPSMVGCGSGARSPGARTAPVKGKVTYQGKPVKAGIVTFEPDGAGKEAMGTINSDGTFELTTYKPGDGAVLGNHRVAVGNAGKAIPLKYASLASSKIEIEVTEGKTDYTIDLK
jgi:hypothetical protein